MTTAVILDCDFGILNCRSGIQNELPQSKIENPKSSGVVEVRLASDALAFIIQVVDDDVIAHLIGRGVEDAAGVQPR